MVCDIVTPWQLAVVGKVNKDIANGNEIVAPALLIRHLRICTAVPHGSSCMALLLTFNVFTRLRRDEALCKSKINDKKRVRLLACAN